jgi:hypothetical protein
VWSTGPAYAYAAFCLRLDPFSAYQASAEHAADDTRAHAILEMWRLMDEEDANLHYSVRREELKGEWDEALNCAKPNGQPDAVAKQTLDAAIKALFIRLKARMLGRFETAAWNKIQPWYRNLLTGNPIALPGDADLRWILNAAWLARIDDPSKFSDIAERAQALRSQFGKSEKSSGLVGNRAGRTITRPQ